MTATIDRATAARPFERRSQARHKLLASATYRERGRSRSSIDVTDISTRGCRIRAQGAVVCGDHGWVTLPTLGPWSCSLVWHGEQEAGLMFERPLHSAVAELMSERHETAA